MKKITAIIFVLMILCSMTLVEAAKKAVVIMPIQNVSGYNSINVPQIMAEKLTISLQNSGKYIVLEREQISDVLREQGFQNIAVNPNSAVEVGKLTGANYSVFGNITFVSVSKSVISRILKKSSEKGVVNGWKAKIEMDIRFVNNETGEVVFAENFVGTKTGIDEKDAVNSACKEAATNFFNKLMSTVVGRIIDVSDNNIYIDQGMDSGFRIGDILTVTRETSPIKVGDKIVGMKTISVGKIKVVEVNAEYSICRIVSVQTGMNIKKDDIIKKG